MKRMRTWGRRLHCLALLLAVLWLAVVLVAPGLAAEEADGGPADAGAAAAAGAVAGDGSDGAAAGDQSPLVRAGASSVVVISAQDIIMGGMEEYIIQSIERAAREEVGLLVIELDTPGGGLNDTQEIVKAMLSARVPIAVYVSPKGAHAGSAGTFITLAGHLAVMAPGTRIGAAHPVQMSLVPDMGGEKNEDEEARKRREEQQAIMNEKVTNDAAMFMVSIAQERGRNAEWAEKSVRESLVATSDEALTKKVIDLVAEDLTDLLEKVHGREIQLDSRTRVRLATRGAKVERWAMSLKQRIWTGLASPEVLMLLILIGLAGIGMEFYHPGMIFPGAVGALCLLLAAISIKILPVSAGGLVLVLAGLGLMIAEIYVTSYGLLGLAGVGLMILGGIFLVDPSAQPYYLDPSMQVDWSVLIPAAVAFGTLFLGIGYFVIRTQRQKIKTGAEGIVGEIGQARTEIGASGGKVAVHGEYWNAVSAEPIAKGAPIEVVRMDGLLLHVKPKR